MQECVLGIDFGTTNSAVGFARSISGDIRLVPVDMDHETIPTALFYSAYGDVIFGRDAISHYVGGEEGRLIRSIKRILGTDLMEKSTIINDKSVKFDTIITTFLNYLKTKAENYCQMDLNSVVIGRPVHFQDNDVQADLKAQEKLQKLATAVGFKNILFQYEPIAAAFAHEKDLLQDKLACVIDLGGGTSDFSVIKIGPTYKKKKERLGDILATFGIRVGGNDLDREFSLASFMPTFGKDTLYGTKNLPVPNFLFSHLSEWSQINFCYTLHNKLLLKDILNQSKSPVKIKRLYELLDMQLAHHLLKKVEDSKIELTKNSSVNTVFSDLSEKLHFFITRKDLDDSIQNEIKKIKNGITETLTLSGLRSDKIDFVILAGGTCEVPLVKNTIKEIFANATISETNKMESVCKGLTLTAQKNFF